MDWRIWSGGRSINTTATLRSGCYTIGLATDEVAPSACERMTCSVNMYIITHKYDWRKRPSPWHVLCLSVLRRYAECIILNCFQYLRDTFLRFQVTEVHYTTPRRTWVFRERGVYSLLCVSGAPLMRVWGISRTSGDQNHHFDAKINIACASLGQKSHKLWGSTQDFAGDPNCCAMVVQLQRKTAS